VKRRLSLLCVLLFLPGVASGAEPTVKVRSSVDRTAVWVADRLTFTVDVQCDRGVDILLDDLAKEKLRVNGLEIISSDASATTDAAERTRHTLRYVLTTYRVDQPEVSIEPIVVRYYARRPGQRLQDMAPAGEVTVPGAVVAYRSTLPDRQPAQGLRDAREAGSRHPFFVRAESVGLALIVISLAPALVMAVAAVRRRTVRRPGRRSARQIRKEKQDTLERLRSQDVGTEEERRRAFDAISAAVREHVANTAHVPAASLTAAEVDAALERSRSRLSRESVTALLAQCDAARYGPPQALPSAEQCRDALTAAEQVLAGR
jgi:hypothetical protein